MLSIFAKELGDDPDITWVMTNANFDNNMLANSGVPLLAGDIHCTLVMDWLYDENRYGRHGLKETALDHLGLNMRSFKKVFSKKRGETYQDALLRMMADSPEDAIDYASLDAWASLAVYKFLKPRLEKEGTATGLKLWDLFYNIEAPYSKVLYHCIRRGIMVDVGWLEEVRKPIVADMEDMQYELNKIAGSELNPDSTPQLRKLFFEDLKRDPIKMTPGGKSGNRQPSTDVHVLTQWADEGCEISQKILAYRALAKVKGTYVDGMIERCDSKLRIHPMLTQHVAVTGRLTSRDPNLQNIPRPDGDKYGLRGAFMPGTGYTLVAVDYRQLEMRLLAVMSGDERMQEVIRNGWDIHMGTASVMYDVSYDNISAAKKAASPSERQLELLGFRQDAKTIGFGLNYGEGVRAMAAKLKCSMEDAKAKIETYFKPYPRVREFIESTHEFCRDYKEVSTVLGRKRRLLEADADWKEGFYHRGRGEWVPERPGRLAARALRQAVNSIIQGSAADVARMAQIRCEESEELHDLGARQILQIHDEILFEVPDENLEEGCEVIKGLMENPFIDLPERVGLDFRDLPVPLDVDVGKGEAWSEAH